MPLSAYLDTNTLHFLGIFLEHAKAIGIYPFDSTGAPDPKERAKDSIGTLTDHGLRRGLRKGLETVWLVLHNDLEVRYAQVTDLELLSGRARGKALLSFAREGVPERFWGKLTEKEIRERVDRHSMFHTRTAVGRIGELIDESGVAIATRASINSLDLFEIAKGVSGLVYMDAIDSVIYANALLSQCDYLFTSDGYLKDTANLIHNAATPRYLATQSELGLLLSTVMLIPKHLVVIPSAHTITADGTTKPQLPP